MSRSMMERLNSIVKKDQKVAFDGEKVILIVKKVKKSPSIVKSNIVN